MFQRRNKAIVKSKFDIQIHWHPLEVSKVHLTNLLGSKHTFPVNGY